MRTRSWPWLSALAVCTICLIRVNVLPAADDAQKKEPPNLEALKSLDPTTALDRQIYDALRTVINAGADLYNREDDRAGCYRLYQGSLLAIRPLLGHHTDLQKTIDTALADADRHPTFAGRAFALRKAMDKIRADLKPPATVAGPSEIKQPSGGGLPTPPEKRPATEKKPPIPPTLWTRLGGGVTVRKVVDDWVALAANDPKANFTRNGRFKLSDAQVAELKDKLVAYISQATGGSIVYQGKSMKEVHKGMGITNAEFDAAIADLRKALEGQGVKPAEAQDVITIVDGTRKDIVETTVEPEKKPAEIKPGDKKSGESKSGTIKSFPF